MPRTIKNILSHAYQYLGFLGTYVHERQPVLADFLDLESYASYVSFQKAKGNTYVHISMQLASARRVLVFLGRGGDELKVRCDAAKDWISRLCKQLSSVMPQASTRTDISDLPAAHEIVQMIERVRQSALSSLPPVGQVMSQETARLLHDASLACLMFGYLPPIRLVCLRTLQMPGSIKCLVPGCTKLGCRGNRLVWHQRHLALQLNHYKVERK